MGRAVQVGLLALLLGIMAGCASARATVAEGQHAIADTPKRFHDALSDPPRVRNIISRSVEAGVGGLAGAACYMALGPLGFLCAPLAAIVSEFVYYEYIAEPAGLTGPYWERGPRLPVIGEDGTSIVEPGEVFRDLPPAICRFHGRTWHYDLEAPGGGWCG